jgi:hypothetical protein
MPGLDSGDDMERPDRDSLLRESHRLNHELGYIGFRHHYFNDPAAIGEWPDPAARERGLRRFWDEQQAGSYASYREDFARYGVEALAAYCDHLRSLLAGDRDAQIDYYRRVSEAGRGDRLREDGGGGGDIEAQEGRPPSPGELAGMRGRARPGSDGRERGRGRGR